MLKTEYREKDDDFDEIREKYKDFTKEELDKKWEEFKRKFYDDKNKSKHI